jgi:hypothetical protein
MRRTAALFTVVATLVAGHAAACAALPARVDVRADVVDLYETQPALLAASGAVRVAFGSRRLAAAALRYDLGSNRLVASGNVALIDGPTTRAGAACALDLESGKGTLLRLDGELPATYAFTLGDPASPVAAPPPPGAFETGETAGLRPYVAAKHAIVVPGVNVRFAGARVMTETGVALPSPSYLYTFGTNQSFAQTSMPATTFDQPYGLLGNATSLLAAHLRYDATSGRPTLGLDGHFVDQNRAYLIASALPTTVGVRFDLAGYRQITPTLSQSLVASAGAGLGVAQYQLQETGRATTTTLLLQQQGGLQTADFRLSTLGREVPRVGYFKFALDLGYDHEAGMQPYPYDARAALEAHYTTPNLRGPFGTTLSSSLDLATTLFDFPRELGSSRVYASASRRLTRTLGVFASVQFLQTFDRYRQNESAYYPTSPPPLPNGLLYYGYSAFAGEATYRTYALQATYSPNPSLNLIVNVVREKDWPQYDGYGLPQNAAGFYLRVRAPGGPTFEIGRTYVFGWGGQRWSPAYTFSVAP